MLRAAGSTLAVFLCLLATARSQKPAPPNDEFDGRLLASRVVIVAAPTDGLLAQVNYDVGDVVTAGAEVARLDAGMQEIETRIAQARAGRRADFERADATLKELAARLERRSNLYAEGLLAGAERDDLVAKQRMAQIDLIAAQESQRLAELEHERTLAELDRSIVRAPISGIVVQRFLSAGEAVTRSAPGIVKVAALDPLEVEVVLPVEKLNDVHAGDPARVFPESFGPDGFVARVKCVEKQVDTASATFIARLELENSDFRLPAGLRCRVRLGH